MAPTGSTNGGSSLAALMHEKLAKHHSDWKFTPVSNGHTIIKVPSSFKLLFLKVPITKTVANISEKTVTVFDYRYYEELARSVRKINQEREALFSVQLDQSVA
jgi:hypothetical protein